MISEKSYEIHLSGNDFSKDDIQEIEARAHYDLDSLSDFRKALREAQTQYEC